MSVFHSYERVGHLLHRPRWFSCGLSLIGNRLSGLGHAASRACITSADGATVSSCRGRWRLRVKQLSHLTSFTSTHRLQWDICEWARAKIITHSRGGSKSQTAFPNNSALLVFSVLSQNQNLWMDTPLSCDACDKVKVWCVKFWSCPRPLVLKGQICSNTYHVT